MAGKVTVSGSGRITPDDEGSVGTWSAGEAVSSVAIGQPSAGTGSVSFGGAQRDETDGHFSEWAISESAVFTHEADGGPELGDYPGTITSITTQGGTVSGTISSTLNLLNAERTIPTQGSFTKPAGPFNVPANYVITGAAMQFLAVPSSQAIAYSSDGERMYVVDGGFEANGDLLSGVYPYTDFLDGTFYGGRSGLFSYGTGNYQFGRGPLDTASLRVAVNPADGNVYIADGWNHRVLVYDDTLTYVGQFGSSGSGDGQFNISGPMAFSPDGATVYVADLGNQRIQYFSTSTLTYSGEWGSAGSGDSQFQAIAGMTADGSGDIYVSDSTQARVKKYGPTGTYLGSYQPTSGMALKFAYSLAYDGTSIYVSDLNSNVTHRLSTSLAFDGLIGSSGSGFGQTRSPRSIAVNPVLRRMIMADVGVLATGDLGNNRFVFFDLASGDYTQPLSAYYQAYVESCIPSAMEPVGDPIALNYVQVPTIPDPSEPLYGWYVNSPSAAGSRSNLGYGVEGGYAYEAWWTSSDSDPDSAVGMGDSHRIRVAPGTPITPSVHARFVGTDSTRNVDMHLAFFDLYNVEIDSSVVASETLINGAGFVRIIGTEAVAPPDTEYVRIFLTNPDAATAPWDPQDHLYLDRMSTAPGEYFDALTVSTTGYAFKWEGTPWVSASGKHGTGYSYQATLDPEVVYPGFTGNVWTKFSELAQANGHEIAVINGTITVRDIMEREISADLFNGPPSLEVNAQGLARAVDIVYQNIDYGDGVVMYDARADNNRIFQIAAGKTETFTISTANYPVVLNSPFPVGSLPIGPGQYYISGSDNLPVVPQEWLDYGGSVEVSIGSRPNEIDITLTGPGEEIPGVPGPYYLAASDGSSNYATLSISGSGVVTNPRTLHLHTGADPVLVTEEVGATVTNIFIDTEAQAYDRGVWASDLYTGPNVTLTGDLDLAACEGFGLTPGSWVRYADSKYRIETVNPNNARASFTARRHVTSGDEADVWSNLPDLTNLSENPSVESDTSDFSTGGGLAAITRSGDWAASGDYSLRLSANSDNNAFAAVGNAYDGTAFLPWGIEPGRTYTISADLHSVQPGSGWWMTLNAGKIAVYYHAGTTAPLLASSDPLDEFTTDAHVAVTFTVPEQADGLRIEFWATAIGTGFYAYWDSFMLTEGAYDYPFFDGNTSGASWLGTPDLSASTKPPDAGDYAAFWDGEPAKNAIIRPLRHPGA